MEKEERTICDICANFIKNEDEKPLLMEQTKEGNYCGVNAYLGKLEGKYRRRITDIKSTQTSHTFYCIYTTHKKIYEKIKNNKILAY